MQANVFQYQALATLIYKAYIYIYIYVRKNNFVVFNKIL